MSNRKPTPPKVSQVDAQIVLNEFLAQKKILIGLTQPKFSTNSKELQVSVTNDGSVVVRQTHGDAMVVINRPGQIAIYEHAVKKQNIKDANQKN